MKINFQKLGKRVKEARILKGITQEKLAEMVCVNPTYICHIENGKKKPSLSVLFSISNALDISLDLLLHDSRKISEHQQYPEITALLQECDEDDIYIVAGLIKVLIKNKQEH